MWEDKSSLRTQFSNLAGVQFLSVGRERIKSLGKAEIRRRLGSSCESKNDCKYVK